jgi:tRNA (guanine37-N1)-methyltransferase
LVDDYTDIILICGRYEGIDHRVELWCQQEFGNHFSKISLGQFVTLGGEIPTMTIIEATARLVPGVIKEELSRQEESYRPEQGGENIEYPQYTRPEEVEGLDVPDILLSGHHAEIEQWRKDHTG